MRPENFIYFFTVCGFFIGVIFSTLHFNDASDILLYTIEITLFFYLFIHIVIMNFVDVKRFGRDIFNKKEYEQISEYFIGELDVREKKMDNLLLDLEKINEQYEKNLKGVPLRDGSKKQAA
ncbi:MAG: hypothetical protein IBX44_09515 [Sulfurospirillum sp.]|nr:hypothetical protein [Sulfurospirillum sp.]